MQWLQPAEPAALHVSVSQVRAFLLCGKKYALRYVQGAEPEHRTTNLVVGSAVHAALAGFYTDLMGGAEPDPVHVLDRYHAAFDHERRGEPPLLLAEGETVDEVRAGGEALVRTFLAGAERPVRVVAVERPLCADVVDPESGEVLEEQLLAYLDAVVEVGGRKVVLEHKTAARAWSQDQLDFDLQVSLYLALTGADLLRLQVLTKTKVSRLLVHDLRRTEREMAEAVAIVCRVLDAIRAGAFWPSPGWACRECEFRRQCRG